MPFFGQPISAKLVAAKPIAAAALAMLIVGAAHAQEAGRAAPTPRCGGLLCDAYYAGVPEGQASPTSLPCHDFVCGMFSGRTSEQPVVAAEPAPAVSEPMAKPAKARKKRVAKAVVKEPKAVAAKVDNKPETAPKPVAAQ